MFKQPLSITKLYIFIFIATVLLPVVYRLGVAYMDSSLDRHGHGIDGVGAALLAGIVFKIIMYVAFGIYIYMLVRIIPSILHYKEVPNILIVVPVIPIILSIALSCYNNIQLKKEQESYTVEAYVAEVQQSIPHYIQNVDGKQTIYAYSYILHCVATDSYWLSLRLHFDQSKRKAIIDEAIPLLMKDLEAEALCAGKFYDGTEHYFPTDIEYWEYKADQDLLIVKFTHTDEAYECHIDYI